MVPGAKKCLCGVMVTVNDGGGGGGTWVFAKDFLLCEWAHYLLNRGTNFYRLALHLPCHSEVPVHPFNHPVMSSMSN